MNITRTREKMRKVQLFKFQHASWCVLRTKYNMLLESQGSILRRFVRCPVHILKCFMNVCHNLLLQYQVEIDQWDSWRMLKIHWGFVSWPFHKKSWPKAPLVFGHIAQDIFSMPVEEVAGKNHGNTEKQPVPLVFGHQFYVEKQKHEQNLWCQDVPTHPSGRLVLVMSRCFKHSWPWNPNQPATVTNVTPPRRCPGSASRCPAARRHHKHLAASFGNCRAWGRETTEMWGQNHFYYQTMVKNETADPKKNMQKCYESGYPQILTSTAISLQSKRT